MRLTVDDRYLFKSILLLGTTGKTAAEDDLKHNLSNKPWLVQNKTSLLVSSQLQLRKT